MQTFDTAQNSDVFMSLEQEVLIHTERRGVVLGENLAFGLVRIQKQKVVQVADAVSQGANREVLGCIRQQIPDQPLT